MSGVIVEKTVAHETKERVTISPLAGKPAPKALLVDLARLEQAYYECKPDQGDPNKTGASSTTRRTADLRTST